MIPRKVANSGTESTLLRSVVMAVPTPMPNRATPTGRPMASTEPKATIRMTMAKASPSTSELGSSKSAKMNPPHLDPQALDLGDVVEDAVADLAGPAEVDVVGHLDVGEGDLPGLVALRGDLAAALLGVRALDQRHVVLLGDLVEHPGHALSDLGVVDPLLGPEHDGADDAGALAAELVVEDVESRLGLDVGQVELVPEGVADRALEDEAEDQDGDPQDQHLLAVVVAPRTESCEHRDLLQGGEHQPFWSSAV